jgi:hypothetical protein
MIRRFHFQVACCPSSVVSNTISTVAMADERLAGSSSVDDFVRDTKIAAVVMGVAESWPWLDPDPGFPL